MHVGRPVLQTELGFRFEFLYDPSQESISSIIQWRR